MDVDVFEKYQIYPGCLQEQKDRKKSKTVIHAGWSSPPPLSYVQQNAPFHLPHYRDFRKLWHYRMDIEKCQDPTKNDFNGEELQFPSNTYYPPGLVCAKEQRRYFCPSSGESGSALMTESKDGQLIIDGLLSFIKGCGAFSFDQSYGSLYPYISLFNPQDFGLEFSVLFQLSNNPSAYTKLSCFLPWIAEQFGLEFESSREDEMQCLEGTGDIEDVTDVENKDCRSNPSSYLESSPFSVEEELPCLLPFYLEDQRIEACIQLGKYRKVKVFRIN